VSEKSGGTLACRQIVVDRNFRVVGKVTHVFKKGSRLLRDAIDDADEG
jgi:hypothetical protein